MTKLQISLTDQETELLAARAAYMGYDVTKYAKFVLASEAREAIASVPVYKVTPKMQKIIDDAYTEDEAGLTKEWKLGSYDT